MKERRAATAVAVALGLAMLVLGAFAAGAVPAFKEVTLLLEDDGAGQWTPELRIYQELAKAGNMKIGNILAIPSANYKDKIPTIIAGGSMPDAMYMSRMPETFKEFGPKGLFLPFGAKEFAALPNLTQRLAKYPEYYKDFKAADGKVYALPYIMDTMGYYASAPILSGWLLKGTKYEDPAKTVQTMDDLYAALQLLLRKTGKAPWIARVASGQDVFADRFGLFWGLETTVYWDEEDGAFNVGPLDRNFKAFLSTLARWYKEGLIHKDIYGMADKTWEQMWLNNEGHFMIENWKGLNYQLIGKGPDGKDRYSDPMDVILPPKVDGKRYWGGRTRTNCTLDKYWVFSSKTKALDNLLAAWNWGYSDAAVNMFNFGIEGTHWNYVQKGTLRFPSFAYPGTPIYDLSKKDDKGLPLQIKDPWDKLRRDYPTVMVSRNGFATRTENYLVSAYPGFEEILQRADWYETEKVVARAEPAVSFTTAETNRIKQLRTPLETHIRGEVAKFVMGSRPIEQVDAFIGEVRNQFKAEELLAIYRDAYKRYAE